MRNTYITTSAPDIDGVPWVSGKRAGPIEGYSPMDGRDVMESCSFNYREFEIRMDQRDVSENAYFRLPFYYPFWDWLGNPGLHKPSGYRLHWTDKTHVFDSRRAFIEKSLFTGFTHDLRTSWGLCEPAKSQDDRKTKIYRSYNHGQSIHNSVVDRIHPDERDSFMSFDESKWNCKVDPEDAQDWLCVSFDDCLVAGENGELSYAWGKNPPDRSTIHKQGTTRMPTLDLVRRVVAQRWGRDHDGNTVCYNRAAQNCELITESFFRRVGKGKYKFSMTCRNEKLQSFPRGLEDLLFQATQHKYAAISPKLHPSQFPEDVSVAARTPEEQCVKDIMRWYKGTFKLKTYQGDDEVMGLINRVGKYSFQSAHHLVEVCRAKRNRGQIGKEWKVPLTIDGKQAYSADNRMIAVNDIRMDRESDAPNFLGVNPSKPNARRPIFHGASYMWADNTAWGRHVKTGRNILEGLENNDFMRRMIVTLENEHGTVLIVGYSPYDNGAREYYKNRTPNYKLAMTHGVPIVAGQVRFRVNDLKCWRPYGRTHTPAMETKDGCLFAYGHKNSKILRSTQPGCPDWVIVLSDRYRGDKRPDRYYPARCNTDKDDFSYEPRHQQGRLVKGRPYRYPVGIRGWSLCDPIEHDNSFFHRRYLEIPTNIYGECDIEPLAFAPWSPKGGVMVPAFVPLGIPSFAFDASPRKMLNCLLEELERRVVKCKRAKTYDYSYEVLELLTKTFWFAKSFGGLFEIFKRQWSMERIDTFCTKAFWMRRTKVRPSSANKYTRHGSCVLPQ